MTSIISCSSAMASFSSSCCTTVCAISCCSRSRSRKSSGCRTISRNCSVSCSSGTMRCRLLSCLRALSIIISCSSSQSTRTCTCTGFSRCECISISICILNHYACSPLVPNVCVKVVVSVYQYVVQLVLVYVSVDLFVCQIIGV